MGYIHLAIIDYNSSTIYLHRVNSSIDTCELVEKWISENTKFQIDEINYIFNHTEIEIIEF